MQLLSGSNAGCISLAENNLGSSGRTKHIELKYHYVRECMQSKEVLLKKISTHENIADIMTKPLERVVFGRHAKLLLHEIQDDSGKVHVEAVMRK